MYGREQDRDSRSKCKYEDSLHRKTRFVDNAFDLLENCVDVDDRYRRMLAYEIEKNVFSVFLNF